MISTRCQEKYYNLKKIVRQFWKINKRGLTTAETHIFFKQIDISLGPCTFWMLRDLISWSIYIIILKFDHDESLELVLYHWVSGRMWLWYIPKQWDYWKDQPFVWNQWLKYYYTVMEEWVYFFLAIKWLKNNDLMIAGLITEFPVISLKIQWFWLGKEKHIYQCNKTLIL